MIKRLSILISLLSIVTAWILSGQVWAIATITETQQQISATATESYPQIALVLTIWLLIILFSRYVKGFFGKFLLSAVTLLLFATVSPVWFDSAAGNVQILSGAITKAVGISDWQAQQELLTKVYYQHTIADFFVIAIIVGLISTLFVVWSGLPKGNASILETRVDRLPKW